MEDSLKKLYKKLESLQINLEEEIKKNKTKDENFYNLTKQLHHTQEAYLEINEELKMMKLENKSILKEMNFILKFFIKITPAFILDIIYQLTSRYRYNIFGKKNVCSFPKSLPRNQILN